jgi:hypothetical protein
VCHATLHDPKLFSFLLLIDQDLAAQAQAAGCACGGVLHSARYPRKPRGAPRELLDQYRSRLSFCCAACRRRTTPESVRYLGRRVYLAAVVLLASAMRAGITGKRVAQLSEWFAVPLRTLERWRRWWLEAFVDSGFWRAARGRLVPPVDLTLLPASLLPRFSGEDLLARLIQALRFIAPLSALDEGR